jgi:tRNA-binding EMAP/Myf-like protein
MSSQKVLSVRATRVLACAGLLSYDEILSPDDNTLILEVIRNANLQHLLGNPNSEKERSEVCDWLSQSQTLSETDLPKIETSLYMKSYLVGYTFTIADAAIYEAIRDKCVSSVSKFPELSRWFDHMQHTCLSAGFETMKFGSPASHFMCLPVSHAAPIRAKKEVVPAVATAKATVIPSTTSTIDKSAEVTSPEVTSEAPEANTNKEKKERKEKKEKKTDAVAETAKGAEVAAVAGDAGDELDPSKLDIRVGIVVKCWNHPDSEKCKLSIKFLSLQISLSVA